MGGIAGQVKELEQKVKDAETELNEMALRLPNRLHAVFLWELQPKTMLWFVQRNKKKTFSFKPKEHWELGEKPRHH